MRRSKVVYRLSLVAVLTALLVVLSYLRINIGNIHITLASLPVVFGALCLPLYDAVLVAFLGEFVIQVLNYGVSATTVIWCLGPVIRALVIAFVSYLFRRKGDELVRHKFFYYLTVVVAAILTTVMNTVAGYVDALIFGYPFSFVLVEATIRLIAGILTALVTASISIPLLSVSGNLFIKQKKDSKKNPE